MTKPCARADRGCPRPITVKQAGASRFVERQYCSRQCGALARMEAGRVMPTFTRAERAANGRQGGLVRGQQRRRDAALRMAARVEQLIPARLWVADTVELERPRLKALLVRVYAAAYKAGRHEAAPSRRRTREQAA